jgi:hypothetical protein
MPFIQNPEPASFTRNFTSSFHTDLRQRVQLQPMNHPLYWWFNIIILLSQIDSVLNLSLSF